ncbi:amino acid ABC transporter ATP-binding protein, partial [Mesorhizobium sp. BR1-1-7]|uniref:amino acid ABC transporter ATP-binding protein n=1 Tax=Mesorhizobium sp. BR1-1-7 TaxID=2876647 RepID=UPI001CCB32D1
VNQELHGHAFERHINKVRQQMGMVFQHFNLFPHLTVIENITMGPVILKSMPKAEARELALGLLSKVGLADKIDAYPSRLSGGQKQRVAIARALGMRPEAILFDEPTSALDPETVGEVLHVMRALAEERMTMLIVTHEIQFAREVSDSVLFLDSGRIVERGPAEELLRNPTQERTRDFLRRVMHPL